MYDIRPFGPLLTKRFIEKDKLILIALYLICILCSLFKADRYIIIFQLFINRKK